MVDLTVLDKFGEVAAEDDAVLDYFLATQTQQQIARGNRLLIVARKGAGKTALVRYFTERPDPDLLSRALQFKSYPWSTHAARADAGASEIEAYIASWEFFIAVELCAMVYQHAPDKGADGVKKIAKFLNENYGSTDTTAGQILGPDTLRVEGSFEPTVLGNKLGKVDLKRQDGNQRLGRDLSALSSAIFHVVESVVTSQLDTKTLLLHFDELDQGLTTLDSQRAAMLIGLVLAAREVRRRFDKAGVKVRPVVYLRSDLWDELRFADKNKITETHALSIEWTEDSLRSLIERRATVLLGTPVSWDQLEDGELMRGSQKKWAHITSRTYLRPRDVIKFCNSVLEELKVRQPDGGVVFENRDVTNARSGYSSYLKAELDDEIVPHWPEWTTALEAISAVQTIVFNVDAFRAAYDARRRATDVDAAEALERLYRFSVIGYQQRSGYGGSTWVFRYQNPSLRWDPGATTCKVHLGLKEYCRLKEERS